MLVLSNTSSSSSRLELGLSTLTDLLLPSCPGLCAVGDLSTWSGVAHFDPASPEHRRGESGLSRLRREAAAGNWDLDLDARDLDFVFDSL